MSFSLGEVSSIALVGWEIVVLFETLLFFFFFKHLTHQRIKKTKENLVDELCKVSGSLPNKFKYWLLQFKLCKIDPNLELKFPYQFILHENVFRGCPIHHTHNSLLQALLEDIGTKWMLHVVHFQVVDFERQELEHWIQWKWWKKKGLHCKNNLLQIMKGRELKEASGSLLPSFLTGRR